jgi:DNA-binding transcriptional ArsR family regulator
MDAKDRTDEVACRIAAAIGEPARARMLYSLMDGRARTSTELAMVAAVKPSTASAHLTRLKTERLVTMLVQGKHRYYSLEGPSVGSVLEGLSVLAGGFSGKFAPTAPGRLRVARTCYDHLAGTAGVLLHDRLRARGWLFPHSSGSNNAYDLSAEGQKAFAGLDIDIAATRALRRRFACPCLDWSERRPHLGGALGAAVLSGALKRNWVTQDLDSRALHITRVGRRELLARFDLSV